MTAVSSWSQIDISDKDVKAISLSCKLGHNKRLNITAVYGPPTGNVQSAPDKVETIINTIRSTTAGYGMVIGGLNVDLLTDNAHTMKITQFSNSC